MPLCRKLALLLLAAGAAPAGTPAVAFLQDLSGSAVAGARWQLVSRTGSVVFSGETGSDGSIECPLAVGSYLLRVDSPHRAVLETPVSIGRGRKPLRLVLELAPVATSITVTASATSIEEVQHAVQSVNSLDRRALESRARAVLAQFAQEEEGIALQRTSGSLAGVVVRGHSGSKNSYFIDGVRFSNSAARGGINTYLSTLDATQFDSVEVLRGPASDRYGSDSIGGSIQLRSPEVGLERAAGEWSAGFNSADASFGSSLKATARAGRLEGVLSLNGSRYNGLRPGRGVDSHAAVTRFLGLPSARLDGPRLAATGSSLFGGVLRGRYRFSEDMDLSAHYTRSQRDGGQRSDQLLGGDGNLRADLRNLMVELFYARFQRYRLGNWRDLGVTVSGSSQREERINQGENGSALALIAHERERITTSGIQAGASRPMGPATLHIGFDRYRDGIAAPSWGWDPGRAVAQPRRGRIPDGASYVSTGVFGHNELDLRGGLIRVTAALRWNDHRYRVEARETLWPADRYTARALAGRGGIALRTRAGFTLAAAFQSGFRAPNVTDLGTVGLSGSGFELGSESLIGRTAVVGTTADSTARPEKPVEELRPERSLAVDLSIRYQNRRVQASLTGFSSTVDDQVVKRSVLLPPGAVGSILAGERIAFQWPSGAVLVGSSANPVLVRANGDDVRLRGLEGRAELRLSDSIRARATFTSIRAHDAHTGLPPEIEGGIPAPGGAFSLLFSPTGRRFWVEPYVHASLAQTRLSTLDLQDRRIGAARSASNIARFFRNGATVRGLVRDGILFETGETLAQVQMRVLGPGLAASPLFRRIPGYALAGVRLGWEIRRRHSVFIDAANLADRNYRGVSWGIDGAGRSVALRYTVRF